MTDLNPRVARRIIEQLGQSGVAPDVGAEHLTVGLDSWLNTIEREYLAGYLRDGGSTFKLVVGRYGGGKTHFLYCIRDLAWKHNFVVAYVELSSTESPFHKIEQVYRAVASALQPPLTEAELLESPAHGMSYFIKSWVGQKVTQLGENGLAPVLESIEHIQSQSFANAMRGAATAYLSNDIGTLEVSTQWLSGEPVSHSLLRRLNVWGRVDKSTAMSMLHSLGQWVRSAGYTGLVILFDEAEPMASLSKKNKEIQLATLRELIDKVAGAGLPGTMVMYAVPDLLFLEGNTGTYEALNQRLKTVFNPHGNWSGVQIRLDELAADETSSRFLLRELGHKLAHVCEVAFDTKVPPEWLEDEITRTTNAAWERRFGDISIHREFVQMLVESLIGRARGVDGCTSLSQ